VTSTQVRTIVPVAVGVVVARRSRGAAGRPARGKPMPATGSFLRQDRSGESVEHALARELAEELGVTVTSRCRG